MNKNSDIVQNMFSLGVAGRTVPQLKFSKLLELSEMSRAMKLIFGLQVNIDKADSRRYDVTRRWYMGGSKYCIYCAKSSSS